MLEEAAFPFLRKKGHVVSLVGGGGKTTLLYAMAAHCAAKGWRVLASTTTHIQKPKTNWAQTAVQRDALWRTGTFVVAGMPAPQNKLTQPPELQDWMQCSDAVFLEADGAKHLPCKAPAEHEPVLLPESDIVLAVAGLSAVGRPLKEVCFRREQACALLGIAPEDLLTPERLTVLLASEQGGRKNVGTRPFMAVLNQADTPHRREAGWEIQDILWTKYNVKSTLTSFAEGERA